MIQQTIPLIVYTCLTLGMSIGFGILFYNTLHTYKQTTGFIIQDTFHNFSYYNEKINEYKRIADFNYNYTVDYISYNGYYIGDFKNINNYTSNTTVYYNVNNVSESFYCDEPYNNWNGCGSPDHDGLVFFTFISFAFSTIMFITTFITTFIVTLKLLLQK